MKKSIAILLLIAVSFTSNACTNVKGSGKITMDDRKVSSFTAIRSTGSVDIEITQGTEEKATVETDDNIQQYVEVTSENGSLTITLKDNVSINTTKLKVHVTCKKLNHISVTGSGDVMSMNSIKTSDFSITQSGSGDIKLNMDASRIDVKKTGSGDLDLKGNTGPFSVVSTGSGDTDASALACTEASINGTGSGDFELKKGISAKVNITGSGEVEYK
jgi:hypothetical protein